MNKFKGLVTRKPFRGDKTTSVNLKVTGTTQQGKTWTKYVDAVMGNDYLKTAPGEGQYVEVEYSSLPSIRTYEKKDGTTGYTLSVWADGIHVTMPDDIAVEVEDETVPF